MFLEDRMIHTDINVAQRKLYVLAYVHSCLRLGILEDTPKDGEHLDLSQYR